MLKDITLGQYFPIDSPLHRMDPRTKIVALVLLIAAIFIANNAATYLLAAAFTLLIMRLSKVSFRMYFKSLKPIWFVIIFTAALNIF